MNMWTAIAIIVVVGVALEAFRLWVKASTEGNKKTDPDLDRRLTALEGRLGNLETIVLKRENDDKWEALKD